MDRSSRKEKEKMSQIVHITFEKLTGLKGEMEGYFIVDISGEVDKRLPMVFHSVDYANARFLFSQGGCTCIWLKPVDFFTYQNYLEHILHGVNFLIKSWSYGGGVTINNQSPN
jgi:hypothetical protein